MGVALSWAIVGCGGTEAGDQEATAMPGSAPAAVSSLAHRKRGVAQVVASVAPTCSSTRSLVCGTDGRTYVNACEAGGTDHVAHVGACAGFVCNGVVCVDGFSCRTFTTFGVAVDQCVSDTGTVPQCSCAAGAHCVQDPSGATRCEQDAPAPAALDPSSLCQNVRCPAGMHCAIITANYGVPTPSCMFN